MLDSKSSVAQVTGGSNPPLSATPVQAIKDFGGVTERPKVRDWKSRVAQVTAGSNPALSANLKVSMANQPMVNPIRDFELMFLH